MQSASQGLTSLFWLAVMAGAVVMVVRNPTKANALIGAGADTITGITHGLESGKLNNT